MIFSAVTFLYLLPLAGLPVLFHFVLRQRRRKLIFSSLLFFNRINPRLNSRRQIKQWLLLLLRVLVIVFTLLALSRPVLRAGANNHSKTALVVIIDNSASMTGLADTGNVDTGVTKLRIAKKASAELITSETPDCRAGFVLLVQDAYIKPMAELITSHKAILQQIEQIKPTHTSGNAAKALEKACDMLHKLPAGGGVVHIFSDLQENEWAGSNQKLTAEALKNITVYFHRIKSRFRSKANIAINSIQLPQQKILPHHPYNIGVVLRNNSAYEGQFHFNFSTSKHEKGSRFITLAAFTNRTINVPLEPDRPGACWLRANINGDSFTADNQANIALMCNSNAIVLLCGEKTDFGALPVAFSPTGKGLFTGIVTHFCKLEQLQKLAQQEKPVMIVTTWNNLQKITTRDISVKNSSGLMVKYLKAGGNLLVVPNPGKVYTASALPDWLKAGITQRKLLMKPQHLMVLDKNNDFWQGINASNAEAILNHCVVKAYYRLELKNSRGSNNYTPLLGIDFNNIILARKKQGLGNIYVCGSAFSPSWNTLVSTGLLVVMAQQMAMKNAGGSAENSNIILRAGQKLRLPVFLKKPSVGNADAAKKDNNANDNNMGNSRENNNTNEIRIISLLGDTMEWKGTQDKLPPFARSGAYLIKIAGKEICLSVLPSNSEFREVYIDNNKIPVMPDDKYFVSNYNPGQQLAMKQFHPVASFDLYLPVLLLAIVALVVEGILANPRRRIGDDRKKDEG